MDERYAVYVVAIPDSNEAFELLLDGNPFVLAWACQRTDLTEEEAVDVTEHRTITID